MELKVILRDEKGRFVKGHIVSKEIRLKMSEAHKGKRFSKEHRDKISESQKGRIISEEVRKKISESEKGKYISKETKWKMSESHKGKILSEECKRKIGEGNKGKIISKELRKRISEWNKGKIRSKEQKEKLSKAFKGKGNPNWKGGLTPLNENIKHCFEYRQWRSDVFTRDNFICQGCEKIGGNLHTHHKKSFSSILQYYEITTLEEALECEELFNINNGITLCRKCHKELHKKLKEIKINGIKSARI